MKPWFEENPARLEFELAKLDAAGIRYEIDTAAKARQKLHLTIWPIVDGQEHRLVVKFPDLYPYFRFEVEAPEVALSRHQHPFQKNLCLIGRATRNWNTSDYLAKSLSERLPTLLGSGQKLPEEPQAEPFSEYYTYGQDSTVFIDSKWSIDPTTTRGSLVLGLLNRLTVGQHILPLRAAVLAVRDMNDKILAEALPEFALHYKHTLVGRWYRLPTAPAVNDPVKVISVVAEQFPQVLDHSVTQEGIKISVVGMVFPEELQQRRYGDGWLFAVRVFPKGHRDPTVYLARTGRAGQADLAQRIPELVSLREKCVTIVGLGCLGAPSALHFTRAGVRELRLVDHDYLDAGTIVRWPFGLQSAARPKVDVISEFIAEHYPYTKVQTWSHQIGSIDDPFEPDLIEQILDGVDLIYDASVELGVNHLLSDLARQRHIPFIELSTTLGVRGGRVTRIDPSRTQGCWMCMLQSTLDGQLPTPIGSEQEIQPAGCANPTYTGAGFDGEEIALMAMRAAVSTLAKQPGEYPPIDWDIGILTLRDDAGRLIAPKWDTFSLPKNPRCPNCAA